MKRKKRESVKTDVDGLTERLRKRAARQLRRHLDSLFQGIRSDFGIEHSDGYLGYRLCEEIFGADGRPVSIGEALGSLLWELEGVLLPVYEERAIAEFMSQVKGLGDRIDTSDEPNEKVPQ